MHKKLFLAAILITLMLIFAAPASAQSGINETYDFTVSDQGWSSVNDGIFTYSTYSIGEGWRVNDTGGNDSILIKIDFGATVTIDSITLILAGEADRPNPVFKIFEGVDQVEGTLLDSVNFDNTLTVTLEGPYTLSQLVVYYDPWEGGSSADETWIESIVLGEGSGEGPGAPGEPYQPIKISQQIEHFEGVSGGGVFLSASRISAVGASNPKRPSHIDPPNVYASISGTIESVVSLGDGTYAIRLEGEVAGVSYTVVYSNVVNVYVLPGEEVLGGCILGQAGPQFAVIESDEENIYQIQYSITNNDIDQIEDWTLHSDPSSNTPCSQNVFNSNCINANPEFSVNGYDWIGIPNYVYAVPSFNNGYATMPFGSSIAQDIVLPVPTSYTVTIAVSPIVTTGTLITVTLGDATESAVATVNLPGAFAVIQIEDLEPTTPDYEPDIYTLKIKSSQSARITRVCLQETATADTPVACRYEWDFPANEHGDWTLGGGAVFGQNLVGTVKNYFGVSDYYLNLPNAATASHPITLQGYDDRDAEYLLTVVANSTPLSLDVGSYATFEVEIDDSPTYSATWSPGGIHWHLTPISTSTTLTIPEGETISTDFVITTDSVTGDSEGLHITAIKIQPVEGFCPGDGQGQTPQPDTEVICNQTLPTPSGMPTDVFSGVVWLIGWVQWLARFLGIAVDCGIHRVIDAFLNPIELLGVLFGGLVRWLLASGTNILRWLAAIVPWIINTALGILAGLIEDIWLAWISLQVTQAAFDQAALAEIILLELWAVLDILFDLASNIVGIITTLIQMIYIIWGYIFNAINGTSTIETGISTCEAIPTTDLFYPLCEINSLIDYAFDLFPGFWGIVLVLCAYIVLTTFDVARGLLRRMFSEAG